MAVSDGDRSCATTTHGWSRCSRLSNRLEQPALDAAQHVHNILRAFAELGIVHRFQQAGVAFAEFFEEVLDVPALVLEPFSMSS